MKKNKASQKKKLSSFLIGNVKDSDGDGYVVGFSKWTDDCAPLNPRKDGWVSKVVDKVKQIVTGKQPTSPQPTQPTQSQPSKNYQTSIDPNKRQSFGGGIKTPMGTPTTPVGSGRTGAGGGATSNTNKGTNNRGGGSGNNNVNPQQPQTSQTPQQQTQQIQNKVDTPVANKVIPILNKQQNYYDTNTGKSYYGYEKPGAIGGELGQQLTNNSYMSKPFPTQTPVPRQTDEFFDKTTKERVEIVKDKFKENPAEGISFLSQKTAEGIDIGANRAANLAVNNGVRISISRPTIGSLFPGLNPGGAAVQLEIPNTTENTYLTQRTFEVSQKNNPIPETSNANSINQTSVMENGRSQTLKTFLSGDRVTLDKYQSQKVIREGINLGSAFVNPIYKIYGAGLIAEGFSYVSNKVESGKLSDIPDDTISTITKYPVQTGLAIAALGYGGYRGIKYLKQPVEYSAPIGFGKTEIEGLVIDKGSVSPGVIVTRRTEPDTIFVKTNRIRDLLGAKPKSVRIQPGRVDVSESPVILSDIGLSAGSTISKREGSNIRKLSEGKASTYEVDNGIVNPEDTVSYYISVANQKKGIPSTSEEMRLVSASKSNANFEYGSTKTEQYGQVAGVVPIFESEQASQYLVGTATKKVNSRKNNVELASGKITVIKPKPEPDINQISNVLSPNQNALKRIQERRKLAAQAFSIGQTSKIKPIVKQVKPNTPNLPIAGGTGGSLALKEAGEIKITSISAKSAAAESREVKESRQEGGVKLEDQDNTSFSFLGGVNTGTDSGFNDGFRFDNGQGSTNLFRLGSGGRERGGERTDTSPRQNESVRLDQPQIQPPKQVPKPTPIPIIPNPIRPTPRPVPPTPKKPNKFIPFLFPNEKNQTKQDQPYDVFVLIEGTNKKKAKYVKINQNPLTQGSALSLGARAVDEGISARFKVVMSKIANAKGKGTAAPRTNVIDTKDNYFQINSYKFRDYSGRAKSPLATGTYIERQRFRADNPQEVSTLQSSKRRKRFRI